MSWLLTFWYVASMTSLGRVKGYYDRTVTLRVSELRVIVNTWHRWNVHYLSSTLNLMLPISELVRLIRICVPGDHSSLVAGFIIFRLISHFLWRTAPIPRIPWLQRIAMGHLGRSVNHADLGWSLNNVRSCLRSPLFMIKKFRFFCAVC